MSLATLYKKKNKTLPTEKSGRQKGQGKRKERGRQEGGTIKRSINSYFTDELQHPKFKSVVQYHITNQFALIPVLFLVSNTNVILSLEKFQKCRNYKLKFLISHHIHIADSK